MADHSFHYGSVLLFCLSLFLTTFFSLIAPSASQVSTFFSCTCRRLLGGEVFPRLLVPVFHTRKSDIQQVSDSDRAPHQVFCHAGQALPLQYCLLLMLPPSPGSVKPDPNIVFGLVSWRVLTSQGPAQSREHGELSQSYSAPTPQDQDWVGVAGDVPTAASRPGQGSLGKQHSPPHSGLPVPCGSPWGSQTHQSSRPEGPRFSLQAHTHAHTCQELGGGLFQTHRIHVKKVKWDKEKHFILNKGIPHNTDLTARTFCDNNIYVRNVRKRMLAIQYL